MGNTTRSLCMARFRPAGPRVRVGTDLVQVIDIERSVAEFGGRFLQRVYTPGEIEPRTLSGVPISRRLDAPFAAKEAVVKALRPSDGVAYTDVNTANRAFAHSSCVGFGLTGTTVYEQVDFYRLCHRSGILVWHDLMFANMDHPIHDEAFATSVEIEVGEFLAEVAHHPSLVILCGGSEVEQQAAMMGLDPSEVTNELGRRFLSDIASKAAPHVHYVPCSPSGGGFPFLVYTGVSQYFGVGAYTLPLEDAHRSAIQVKSECLEVPNVRCRQPVDQFLHDGERPVHFPPWKSRVPRDSRTGWDFVFVRDHYVRTIFGVDPSVVRYSDSDRYPDLGRAATCVAVESTLNEFRRAGSTCHDALVVLLRYLWEGDGWRIIDSKGRPKSTYCALERAGSPLAVLVMDEGLDGVFGQFVNDAASGCHSEYRTFGTVLSIDLSGYRPKENLFQLTPRIKRTVACQAVDDVSRVVGDVRALSQLAAVPCRS